MALSKDLAPRSFSMKAEPLSKDFCAQSVASAPNIWKHREKTRRRCRALDSIVPMFLQIAARRSRWLILLDFGHGMIVPGHGGGIFQASFTKAFPASSAMGPSRAAPELAPAATEASVVVRFVELLMKSCKFLDSEQQQLRQQNIAMQQHD